ncbi:hypothetical protein [Mycoplasmopsis sturni]|uniref:hypothetical protein n=1 Tax=Mycoplasmopsis sturni TaxID=39047 RepID=UPI000A553644|nr:hypothetical protein [Mycoplasmopsis sturni]
MNKIIEALKWLFAFSKKASLKFIASANLSESEFNELEQAYKIQSIKRNLQK